MSILRQDKSLAVDLEFMTEVDAALRGTGKRWPYLTGIGLLVAFVLFLIWAGFSTRPELTRGEGQLKPSLGVQPVQSPESGIIIEILVKEGQDVKKGQVLATLSNAEALAGFNELTKKKVEYEFAVRRLTAEQEGKAPVFTAEEQNTHPDSVQDQVMLHAARMEKYGGEERELRAVLAGRNLELQDAQERRKVFEQSLTLLRQQEEKVKPLVRQRIYPEVNFLNLQQRIASQTQELAGLAQNISRLRSAIDETSARLDNLTPERSAALGVELQGITTELNSVNERLSSGGYRLDSRRLTAPMDGTIKRILIKEQSVARQADMIMELLPANDTLEVSAKFRPADRSRIEVGRNATIKVSAYDFTIYGTLDAKVTAISPDTIEDSKGQSWYQVRLRTETATLPHADKNLQLEAGMTVSVEVHSGEKSILSYLLKPLFKSRQGVTSTGGVPDHSQDKPAAPEAPEKAS